VALGDAQPQAARSYHLAIALCAAVLLAVLGDLGVVISPATGDYGRSVETDLTIGSELVTFGDTRHRDGNCDHDHKSTECSPCPSCSGALPFMAGEDPGVIALVRAPLLQSHYDGVVPRGIRRPPRLS